MKKQAYLTPQLHELLYQALETERGGKNIYQTALSCVLNDDLKGEWQEYLAQTLTHEHILLTVFGELDLDPDIRPAGCDIVAFISNALVSAMDMAKASGTAQAAQLVAAECVVLAETKDQQNWELIGHVAAHGDGDETAALHTAFAQVEQEEHHHLYHTKGFLRELWIQSLGLPAVLPPPEEVKKVASAIGAARAEGQRDDMLDNAAGT